MATGLGDWLQRYKARQPAQLETGIATQQRPPSLPGEQVHAMGSPQQSFASQVVRSQPGPGSIPSGFGFGTVTQQQPPSLPGTPRNDYYNPYGQTSAQAANQQQAVQNLTGYLNSLGITANNGQRAGAPGPGPRTPPPPAFGNQGGQTNATQQQPGWNSSWVEQEKRLGNPPPNWGPATTPQQIQQAVNLIQNRPRETAAPPTGAVPPPQGLTPQQIAGFQAWRQQNPTGTMQQYVNGLMQPQQTLQSAMSNPNRLQLGQTMPGLNGPTDTLPQREPPPAGITPYQGGPAMQQAIAAWQAANGGATKTVQADPSQGNYTYQMVNLPWWAPGPIMPGSQGQNGPTQTVGSITSNQGATAGQPVRTPNPVAFGNPNLNGTGRDQMGPTEQVTSPTSGTMPAPSLHEVNFGPGGVVRPPAAVPGQPTRPVNPIAPGNQGGQTNAPALPPPAQPAYNPMTDQNASGYLNEIRQMDPQAYDALTKASAGGAIQNFGDFLSKYNTWRAQNNAQRANPNPGQVAPATLQQQQNDQATLAALQGGRGFESAVNQHPEDVALQNAWRGYQSAVIGGNPQQANVMLGQLQTRVAQQGYPVIGTGVQDQGGFTGPSAG